MAIEVLAIAGTKQRHLLAAGDLGVEVVREILVQRRADAGGAEPELAHPPPGRGRERQEIARQLRQILVEVEDGVAARRAQKLVEPHPVVVDAAPRIVGDEAIVDAADQDLPLAEIFRQIFRRPQSARRPIFDGAAQELHGQP
jgi:hypothetical protein